jgi:hypothetical protein
MAESVGHTQEGRSFQVPKCPIYEPLKVKIRGIQKRIFRRVSTEQLWSLIELSWLGIRKRRVNGISVAKDRKRIADSQNLNIASFIKHPYPEQRRKRPAIKRSLLHPRHALSIVQAAELSDGFIDPLTCELRISRVPTHENLRPRCRIKRYGCTVTESVEPLPGRLVAILIRLALNFWDRKDIGPSVSLGFHVSTSPISNQFGTGTNLEEVDDALRVTIENETARPIRNRVAFVAGKLCQVRGKRARHTKEHPRIVIGETGSRCRKQNLSAASSRNMKVEQQSWTVIRWYLAKTIGYVFWGAVVRQERAPILTISRATGSFTKKRT